MRNLIRSRGGIVLAFVLGAACASAATATAAALITGAQIKDGTITNRDLGPTLRAKIAEGLVPFQPHRGRMVSGVVAVRGAPTADGYVETGVSFPAPVTSALKTQVIPVGSRGTLQCQGSADEPSAGRGYMCLYLTARFGTGSVAVLHPVSQEPRTTSRFGFVVQIQDGGPDAGLRGVWAATSP